MREIPRMLTIREAAKETGLSEHMVRMLCRQRKIVCFTSGRKYIINLDKLIDYLNGEEHGDDLLFRRS